MSANVWTELCPAVFATWSNYWHGRNCAAPPLVAYKPTMSGGIIMLAPLPAPWVREFVQAHETDTAVLYESQGETLAEGSPQYLGVWAAFSAIHRSAIPQPKGRPVLPMAIPKLPNVAEMKRRWLA